MRPTVNLYGLLALAAAIPSTALAGITVTATIEHPAGAVAAGSTLQVSCLAEGSAGGMAGATNVVSVAVAVSGGDVASAALTGAVSAPCASGAGTCSVLRGSVEWRTPAAPGTLTATCLATYQGGFGGVQTASSPPASVTTVAAALPPVVSPISGPAELAVGTTASFDVAASDADASRRLTYAWSATGGTIAASEADASTATWEAPAEPGAYVISVEVSNGATSTVVRTIVSAVLATYQADLALALVAPRRLAVGAGGEIYVVDGRQGRTGQVMLLTPRGELRGFATVPEPALAVAVGGGALWVTTTAGSVFELDAVTGRVVGKLALADGPFSSPSGIAYDPTHRTLWVADVAASCVRVLRLDGTPFATLTSAGGAPLSQPIDVAVDPASGRAWVVRFSAYELPGEPAAAGRFLHAFALDGEYVGSYAPRGFAAGALTRPGGITVAPATGHVYVSDVYQGWIQVFDRAGAPLGTIGAWGYGEGQLFNPMGLAVLASGDLVVANTTLGRVDRFGVGVPLPSCGGDLDCDRLPDAWELAEGLDPSWAFDALLDDDRDGLLNVEERAHGTSPLRGDTDRDGYPDRLEVLAGFDPADPADYPATVAASGPGEVTPGLVELSAVVSGPSRCRVRWTRSAGPPVTLRGAESLAPSFVARAAGAYELEAVAVCGARTSDPARVRVEVKNVAPRAEAGPLVVIRPGDEIRLDALRSCDANGDALTYAWDQTLGPPVTGARAGGVLTASPRGAGLYSFRVTVADPAGATDTAEVPVLVTAAPVATAVAVALPAEAQAGTPVLLDATASFVASGGAAYAWEQVDGPLVPLDGADRAVAAFVPREAGRYAFSVRVGNGRLVSPPATVEVLVAPAEGALPAIVSATAPGLVDVNAPARLEAVGAKVGLAYAWRQLSGPAAGLGGAAGPVATAVPFAPGFYVFEVVARDGAAESRPVRVAFEAREGGSAIPQARIELAAGSPVAGQPVILDGRGSVGASRFRWSQVGGPWVPLGEADELLTFHPHAAGRYAFELEVEDGGVRSAPARVEVEVAAARGR